LEEGTGVQLEYFEHEHEGKRHKPW
jgi:hypothetical protein